KAGRGMPCTRDEADAIRDGMGLDPVTDDTWRKWREGCSAQLDASERKA
ncbi:hypothetical protein LCGC14_2791690, partial [marine sediment metagenome]